MILSLADYHEPESGLDAKFSVYHTAAVALLFGQATPVQFTDEVVKNSTVVQLRDKVSVTSDEDVGDQEAFVAVEFVDGTRLEVHVEHVLGSIENPMSDQQLETKLLDHVGDYAGEKGAKGDFRAFSQIANATDVGAIARVFKKGT